MKKAERIYAGHLNIDTSTNTIGVNDWRKLVKGEGIEAGKKRSKYGAVKTIVDDIKFDSKAESQRYLELEMMRKEKLIGKVIRQYEFELTAGIIYRCDFLYLDFKLKDFVVEDVKGVLTPEYKLKKKLMLDNYGIKIKEIK